MPAAADNAAASEASSGGRARSRSPPARSGGTRRGKKAALQATLPHVTSLEELTLRAGDPELLAKARRLFDLYGCVVVHGMNTSYVDVIKAQVDRMAEQSIMCDLQGKLDKIDEGWVAPNGTLFIPAAWDGTALEKNRDGVVKDQVATSDFVQEDDASVPRHARHANGKLRDKQIMVLSVDYFTSADLLSCAMDKRVLDVVEAISGSPNVEVFGNGQLVYKEPGGGHVVSFHQDASFFEFEGLGPVGTLNYCVDTSAAKGNGALYVVPGSHKLGFLEHSDTSSHLGLPEWSTSDALSIDAPAGTAIFFHQYLIHGSPPNHSDAARPTFINRYTRPEDQVIMPLATSVAMRTAALESAKTTAPKRERGLMARGERLRLASELSELGDKSKGQFH